MDHRNNHHPNYQSLITTSTTAGSSCQVYTGMGAAQNNQTTFTYLTGSGQETIALSALMPDTVYRYLCRCGCKEEFSASGSQIRNFNVLAGGPEMFAKGPTSGSLNVSAIPAAQPTPPRKIYIDHAPDRDKTGFAYVAEENGEEGVVRRYYDHKGLVRKIEMDDARPGQVFVMGSSGVPEWQDKPNDEDDVVDVEDAEREDSEDTELLETQSGIFDRDHEELNRTRAEIAQAGGIPEIGDVSWSKATGAGPFLILAETNINVSANKLLVKLNDGGTTKEACTIKKNETELKQLDAWLVKDRWGRLKTFPKVELTTLPQCSRPSFFKILLWAATFSAFIVAGWMLHH
jgi:hypothetical protein